MTNSRKSRTPIQCESCKRFGHNISPPQICIFSAQLQHALAYKASNTKVFERNADDFRVANAPRAIQKLHMQFQDQFENLTQNEEENFRYSIATVFRDAWHEDTDTASQEQDQQE